MAKQKESVEQSVKSIIRKYRTRKKKQLKEEKARLKKKEDERLKFRKPHKKMMKELVRPVLERLCKLAKEEKMYVDIYPLSDTESWQVECTVHGLEDLPYFYISVTAEYEMEDIEMHTATVTGPEPQKGDFEKTLKFKPAKLTKQVLEREFLAGLKATFGQ